MTSYPPGCSHLFASTSSQQDGPYCVHLRKEYIRAVLQDLHHSYHYVYALLENLPENRFAIIRYHDHVRNCLQPDSPQHDKRLTLRQFREHFDFLHEQDRFRVHFFTEVFYYEQGFTPKSMELLYRHYLKYICTKCLRENIPFRLTNTQVKVYGLTKADAAFIRSQLREYRKQIRNNSPETSLCCVSTDYPATDQETAEPSRAPLAAKPDCDTASEKEAPEFGLTEYFTTFVPNKDALQ